MATPRLAMAPPPTNIGQVRGSDHVERMAQRLAGTRLGSTIGRGSILRGHSGEMVLPACAISTTG